MRKVDRSIPKTVLAVRALKMEKERERQEHMTEDAQNLYQPKKITAEMRRLPHFVYHCGCPGSTPHTEQCSPYVPVSLLCARCGNIVKPKVVKAPSYGDGRIKKASEYA